MTLTLMILIIKIFLLGWFISRFSPIQWILEGIENNFHAKRHFIHMTFFLIREMTSCGKCSAFWVGLVIGGLWPALIASFLSFWYDKLLSPYENKIIFPVNEQERN